MPSPAREFENITWTFTGVPGDVVMLLYSLDPLNVWVPSAYGHLVMGVSAPLPLLVLGLVNGSNTFTIDNAFPDMGPGIEAATVYFQSLFRGVDESLTLGPVSSMVLIDDAL